MNQASQRFGYVLMLTLLLIALAGLVLAGLARHSLLLAQESLHAETDLQRRWGARSCELALLGQSDEILNCLEATRHQNAGDRQPVGQWETSVTLGAMTFDLLLADEDAKLNLNRLYSRGREQDLAHLVRELTRLDSVGSLEVLLRPHSLGTADESNNLRSRENVRKAAAPFLPSEPFVSVAGAGTRTGLRDSGLSRAAVFGSWGQVFALERIAMEAPVAVALAAATRDLTCWGSGSLNLRRASDVAVESICRWVSGADVGRRLNQIRRQDPNRKLAEMLNRLQLAYEERAQLQQLMTNHSSCYSLWLTMSRDRQQWYEFCIAVHDGEKTSSDTANSSSEATGPSPDLFVQLFHFVW